ncbi:MAG: hypothetical protein JWO59_460, partial [Chloroflexi bacterium]|nr:hypothetical protein [Chloroflexota bacterium]
VNVGGNAIVDQPIGDILEVFTLH